MPNPDDDQGYAVIYGLEKWPKAMDPPEGLKATQYATLAGSVAGFAYLAPNPDDDQGYAVALEATAIADPSGLKATP